MRKLSRAWFAYPIGILFILSSVYVYIQFTNGYKENLTTMTTFKPLRLLQVGEVIQSDMVRSVTIPVVAHHAQSYTELSMIIGKKVRVPLGMDDEFADWKLTTGMLAPESGQFYYSFKADALQNVSNLVRRGDRVDVWVEFDTPKWFLDHKGVRTSVGSVKLIENLLVAYVKGMEGQEIIEANGALSALNPAQLHDQGRQAGELEAYRSKPNGKPEINTYIMSEVEYNAYVMGALGGKIKLALPNLYTENQQKSKVTETFEQLQNTDIFNKEIKKQEVQVNKTIPSEVSSR